MFCDQCGAQLQTGQQTCARCGKPVVGLIYRKNRVQEHVRLLGILWLAYSAMTVLGAIALEVVAHTILSPDTPNFPGPPMGVRLWLSPFLTIIGGVIVLKAALGFIAGWGLLQREHWGRTAALVVGFVSLFNVPIGTALGIYTLWVLLPGQSEDEYKSFANAA